MIHKPLIWPVAALGLVVLGIDLIINPNDFGAQYDLAHFSIAPRPAWGWTLTIIGALTVGARFAPNHARWARAQHRAATACVFAETFLYAFWGLIWLFAKLLAGTSNSVAPIVAWLVVAWAVAIDAAQHGCSRDR